MKKMNKKGFTIVELVIVIAVIAILSAVLIPTFSNMIKSANETAALQEARNAYTEYVAKNAKEESFATDLYIEVKGDKYVIVKGSQVQNDKVYNTLAEAQAATGDASIDENALVLAEDGTTSKAPCKTSHTYTDETDTVCDKCGATKS